MGIIKYNFPLSTEDLKTMTRFADSVRMALPLLSLFFAVFCIVLKEPKFNMEGVTQWQSLGRRKAVNTYSKKGDSGGKTAVKGDGLIDNHISFVVAAFYNQSLSTQWIDMLEMSKEHKLRNKPSKFQLSDLLYQKYDLPYPITDRDFVMRRDMAFDGTRKVVKALYRSVEDKKYPLHKGVIRAETMYADWIFRALGPNQTHVEIETISDLKGGLPTFFVNYLQSQWPSNTIDSLRRLTGKLVSAGNLLPMKSIEKW